MALAAACTATVAWANKLAVSEGQEIAARSDLSDRMTVAVQIDGRGPFAFVVDTGAERTVISTELAEQLRLQPIAPTQLLSLSELSTVPTVLVPNLSVSGMVMARIDAPALAREHLGAAGILGLDMLQQQRVVFDFKRSRMTVAPSAEQEEQRDGDEIVVRARSRFGRLVLADATADGQKVYVIIDSGAQVSIGNPALLRKLVARHRAQGTVMDLTSVTGGVMQVNAAILRKVRIGGVQFENIPVAIADSKVFHRLQLTERPALLLGMDVLRSFDRVSIDFANRKVHFLLPGDAMRQPDGRSVRIEPRPDADIS
jgi:predicted aspartyl protease